MASPARTSARCASRRRIVTRFPIRLFQFSGFPFSAFSTASPRRHLCGVPGTKYRPASACVRDGLDSLQPLHSLTHPLPAADCSRSFRRPQSRRDRQSSSGRTRRKSKWPRDFVRPGGCRPCLPIAATPASLPSLRSSPVRLAPALGNWPALLMAELTGPRPRRWTPRPAVSGFALAPENRPAFRYVPAAGTQKTWHRAIATVPRNEVTRRNC